MKNSIKQMLRTPLRTTLFFVLIIFAALLMTLGVCIRQKSQKTIEAYENQFITIGTVRQNATAYSQVKLWDAEKKDYEIFRTAQYDSYLTTDVLQFPGAEYLAGPEQRAYYGSYTPEYLKLWRSYNPKQTIYTDFIAEFTPKEDFWSGESGKIKITRVIGGDPKMEEQVLWFCDHENPDPEMLYKDKTYVAKLNHDLYIHGETAEKAKKESALLETAREYIPDSLVSSLRQMDGSLVEDDFPDDLRVFEVTDGFYETEAGRRLLNFASLEGNWIYIQPVTGTGSTCLLMPFYQGDSYICEGRDISEEEYQNGSKVCLAPRIFMDNNGLVLGDKVHVQLLYTNTRANAGTDFWLDGACSILSCMIDENGDPIEPFEESEYTIVGVYDTMIGNAEEKFSSGADELIVPLKSIENRNGNNLVRSAPMRDETTSFRIPNGTTEEFLKGWKEYGTDELEITFYDMGYSQLKAGMENIRNLSLFFLFSGIILTGLLLFFFSHLFITKQAVRTAIERSLGMRCRQCRRSILSGFILLLLLGSMIGSAGGALISRHISAMQTEKSYYDSTYSVGAINMANAVDVGEITDISMGLSALCCTMIITAAGAVIAIVKMNRSLKREPIQLLSERQKE